MSKELVAALKKAIEHEREAATRYREMALYADEPETRLLLEQIALEEENHLNILTKRLQAIKLLG
ncbi:MAG: ferritin family protein [Syntrophomonadaceae bacterium]|nr:ferritin family protein [Syntrophomonadaceae bacterium]